MTGSRGFTLIELAIVMVILSALLGTLLVPFAGVIERARLKQASTALHGDITRALLGFAASRAGGPYLPCPDCRTACAGGTANDGIEDRSAGVCITRAGNLPWVSLGTGASDPWDARYSYAVHPAFADANTPFGLAAPDLSDDAGDAAVIDENGNALVGSARLAPAPEGAVAVVFSHGRNRFGALSVHGVVQPDPPLGPGGPYDGEWENLDGDALYVAAPVMRLERGSPREFDDLLIWIPAIGLRGFMLQAGVL